MLRDDQLRLLAISTEEGVESFRAAIESFPDERFYAMCFYSDSDITSLYPHANTLESLQRIDVSHDPNYFKWAPAEWKLNFGQYSSSVFMKETNKLLRASALATVDFRAYKRETISVLSRALINIRNSSIFTGHADVERLAFWVNIGDACGEEEWMFEPVVDHMAPDIVEELRQLFEFKAQRKPS